MKITLISQEIYDRLKAIYDQYPALIFQNEPYQYLDKSKLTDIELDMFEQVETILREHIDGFSKFNNFRTKPNHDISLRFHYNYNYDNDGIPFDGIGYILLDELLNGFEEKESSNG